MLQVLKNSFERPLQPMERLSEILFGLIMALTFTCSLSVAGAGRAEVRTVVPDIKAALRASNWVGVMMLFLTGYAFGKYAGHRPWSMAVVMVLLGLAMVATTISLGG